MGYGDEMMASGQAKGLARVGRRAAFGDGQKIIWGPWAATIFKNNPNIAPPGSEGAADLQWIENYKGKRPYNAPGGRGWLWNYSFRATPGEIYLDAAEEDFADDKVRGSFVMIEPNAPIKSLAPNKQWPQSRWLAVSAALAAAGVRMVQPVHHGTRLRLPEAELVLTQDIRKALAILSKASLFIGHEGGMHHGAAAFGVKAVVIFGGFIPPDVTGYDFHTNLAAGAPACGSTRPCEHCRLALEEITVGQVVDSAMGLLDAGKIPTHRRVG